ncbi:MAG: LysR substrate-binding domain-containing protein, partial [Candidatus Odinarchaeota archaeon]
MKIEFLRNFIKLNRYKNFSKLAHILSISQSTLSHQISQLEKELNEILIDRTTKKFKITEQGKILLIYAEKIVNLFDSCKQELSEHDKKQVEDIIITASTYPGSHILPQFIANFKNDHPNVNFKILINNSQKSIELISEEMADFAGIGSFMKYNKGDFDYIKIGEDKLIFICSPNHNLMKKGNPSINFNELVKYPFIWREKGSGTRDIIEQQFPQYKHLNLKLEINDNDSIISAVSGSNYISIISELIAKKAEDAGLIKTLKIQEFPVIAKREIYFANPAFVIQYFLPFKTHSSPSCS